MPTPRIVNLAEKPPAFQLEAVGEYLRIGPDTLIRYDQIIGLRGVDVVIQPPMLKGEDETPEAFLQRVDTSTETMRCTHLYLTSAIQIQDAYGRPVERLICPHPEKDILEMISQIRTWALRTTGRYMKEGAE